jgi:hypothetical protein
MHTTCVFEIADEPGVLPSASSIFGICPRLLRSCATLRCKGRAIAQAGSRWLPTMAARFQTRV